MRFRSRSFRKHDTPATILLSQLNQFLRGALGRWDPLLLELRKRGTPAPVDLRDKRGCPGRFENILCRERRCALWSRCFRHKLFELLFQLLQSCPAGFDQLLGVCEPAVFFFREMRRFHPQRDSIGGDEDANGRMERAVFQYTSKRHDDEILVFLTGNRVAKRERERNDVV